MELGVDLAAADRKVRLGAGHGHQHVREAGRGKIDAAGRRTALRVPRALPAQRLGRAQGGIDGEAAFAGRALGLGGEHELTVGRQANGPRDGAALLFADVGVELDGLAAAEIEHGPQMVAALQQALGADRALLPASALEGVVPGQVVEALAAAELRPQVEPCREGVDGGRDRRSAGRRALGRERRPTQDDDLAGRDLIGMEAAGEQLGVAPPDVQVLRVEPDALFVDDGQPTDGEVAPQVAADALDLQPAHAADLQAVGARLDEHPPLGGDGAVAHERQRRRDQQHETDRDHDDPAGRAETPPYLDDDLLHLVGRVFRQKLCPMLM